LFSLNEGFSERLGKENVDSRVRLRCDGVVLRFRGDAAPIAASSLLNLKNM